MSRASRTAAVAGPDEAPRPAPQRSAMLERFGLLARLLVRFAFAQVRVRPELVERVRQLSTQGTVIYVMRYRSTIDYLLVNAVLRREGLPLARFAPGVSTMWWRPIREIARLLLRRGAQPASRPTEVCARLVAAGEPILLFMRSHAVAGRRRRALAAARLGPQFLREVVRAAGAASRPAFLVPIAIFRGTGFHKRESRFATLLYSVQEAPGEAKRLFTTCGTRARRSSPSAGDQPAPLRRRAPAGGRGPQRAPAGARHADRPLSRGADGARADAAAPPRRARDGSA